MTDSALDPTVRVRFCPSPTGSPHVGLARTALFNWAFARHHGGTFVFRIEDTDAARDSQESYDTLLEVMRWLGFTWDEGPELGGPHAPYRQSERYDIYRDVASRLHEAGRAYHCYCSTEELEDRNARARAEGRAPGYDGHCRELTAEQVAAFEAEGRKPVLRFRMPDSAITFDDLVRGEITFQPENVPDYALVRANGHPLYTLVNPVDDALMEITHVLRGEDLLSSTPRQVALYDALAEIGVGNGSTPRFGHLPYVMGQGNKKLSKRDPESSLLGYREQGFLPEGLLNYLALLGWSPGGDREILPEAEMISLFTLEGIQKKASVFDTTKLEWMNGQYLSARPAEELLGPVRHHLDELRESGESRVLPPALPFAVWPIAYRNPTFRLRLPAETAPRGVGNGAVHRHLLRRRELRQDLIVQPVGAEPRVFGEEVAATETHVRIGMAVRPLEGRGFDLLFRPHAIIGVGRHRLLAAAELLAALAVAFFLPLVHLDLAGERETVAGHAEFAVADAAGRLGLAGDMDELAIVGGIDARGIRADDDALALGQRLVGLDRAALVPEQQNDADDQQQQAEQHALDRFPDAGEPGGACRLGERIRDVALAARHAVVDVEIAVGHAFPRP